MGGIGGGRGLPVTTATRSALMVPSGTETLTGGLSLYTRSNIAPWNRGTKLVGRSPVTTAVKRCQTIILQIAVESRVGVEEWGGVSTAHCLDRVWADRETAGLKFQA